MLFNVSLELHLYTIYICVIYTISNKLSNAVISIYCCYTTNLYIAQTFLECSAQFSDIKND